MQRLFDLGDRRTLTDEEQAKLRALVAAWGRRVREQGVRGIAAERGLPVDQVRADLDADLERAVAWWAEIQADPAQLDALVEEARERQRKNCSTFSLSTRW